VPRAPRRWFLPRRPDVLGVLRTQAAATASAAEAFRRWSATGAEADALAVRDAEHAGDDARRALVGVLREVLSSPVDQEDLYTISERLDRIENLAKNVVRLAEAVGWRPDGHAARMAAEAASGVRHLVSGLGVIATDHDAAARAADEATKAARRLEKAHRQALHELAGRADLTAAEVVVTADLYGRYAALAEAVVGVAHRLWYTVLKEG
jgi:hypothetical protein